MRVHKLDTELVIFSKNDNIVRIEGDEKNYLKYPDTYKSFKSLRNK
jgi:hypothetical protein